MCGTSDAPAGDTTSNLVGWWKLDEGSGISTADSSGDGNTGTLQNSPAWTAGISGNALAFSGSNQYVSLTDSANLRLGGTNILTLAAWVKRGTASATGGIVQKSTMSSGGYTMVPAPRPSAR
jgi:hypothetical protein